jgi:uncharacterized protein
MKKPLKINKNYAGFFRFKKNPDGYLITNDFGCFSRLKDDEFADFISGKINRKGPLHNDLDRKLFLKRRSATWKAAERYHDRYSYLLDGPSLHIVVVTLRCNYKCVYCQANRKDEGLLEYDMTRETAKNTVDRIFESPGRLITIEFQGGEPLLNWPVVKFIIEYAFEKNIESKKDLRMGLVTNLSLMRNEIYDFLKAHNVSICTSLDGPEAVHNKNRPCPQMNSYKATTDWIKKIKAKEKQMQSKTGRSDSRKLSALMTITRASLKNPRKIVDEYIKYGFNALHFRRLSCLGFSGGAAKDLIGYTAEEFIAGWKDAMDYTIKLNLRGSFFSERGALIFLKKILTGKDPGYLDVRSPCGAGVGQLAYNYDGKVYVCDEARTLENETFLLGDVNKQDYRKIVSSPKVKTVLLSSTLDNCSCDECVYKPYCGVCPVLNYVLHGSIFPQMVCTDSCKINSAMLDYIFEKLKNKAVAEIFSSWVKVF